ncbi:MAG: hypothetical protein OH338_03070 [Candidatus Parvarchaeota archaeon]|nr:hypothetical protein [Candidatus Parvarchaeota archaeon]MCW1295641.1 hypothetical protein [Candidatus Parvarchaeum tengchongense]MCW1298721.1 hypothetical protein [Candidatus Parvarchaeum tengchongense]MCW1312386.1 hypothetical protein [Candidatus Parvarchaeum tengchongense]
MAVERERIPAVVVLMLILIGSIVIYLLLVPAPVAYKLLGINNTSVSTPSVPAGEYYQNLDTYIGGNSKSVNTSYTLGTFGVNYPIINSTIFNASSVSIGSSIFGSSSYNINLNLSQSSDYFIEITVQSVSGTPRLSFSLNGNSFFSTLPAKNETIIKEIPNTGTGKYVLSVTDSLNGFALSQSFKLAKIKIIKEQGKNNANILPIKVLTFSGVGDYSIVYTPIGYGNLNVSVNGQVISSINNGDNSQLTVNIPSIVISKAIRNSNLSSSSIILPLLFNVGFQPAENVSYEIANAYLNYTIPYIAANSPTVYYSVNATHGNYLLTLYVSSIIRKGNIYLYFTPSGANLTIAANTLSDGENVLLIPSNLIGVTATNGNYSGTIKLSTDGLVIPSYISIKSVKG